MRIYVIPDENETKFQSFKRKAKEKSKIATLIMKEVALDKKF